MDSFAASGSGHLLLPSSRLYVKCAGTVQGDFNVDGLGFLVIATNNDALGVAIQSGVATFNVHVQLMSGSITVSPSAVVTFYDLEWDQGVLDGPIILQGRTYVPPASFTVAGPGLLLQNYGDLTWALPLSAISLPMAGQLMNYPGATVTFVTSSEPSFIPLIALDNRGLMAFDSTGRALLSGISFWNSGNVTFGQNTVVSIHYHFTKINKQINK